MVDIRFYYLQYFLVAISFEKNHKKQWPWSRIMLAKVVCRLSARLYCKAMVYTVDWLTKSYSNCFAVLTIKSEKVRLPWWSSD